MSQQQPDPIRDMRFAAGLVKLGAGCRQEIDDLTLETYREALAHQVAPDEWEAYVRESNQCGRYQWFPKIHELLEDLHEFRGRQTPASRLIPARTDAAWEQRVEESQQERRANARKGLELIKAAYAESVKQQAPPPTPEPPKPTKAVEPTAADVSRREERLRVLREQAEALKTDNAVVTSEV
jgi:hypothetical protein